MGNKRKLLIITANVLGNYLLLHQKCWEFFYYYNKSAGKLFIITANVLGNERKLLIITAKGMGNIRKLLIITAKVLGNCLGIITAKVLGNCVLLLQKCWEIAYYYSKSAGRYKEIASLFYSDYSVYLEGTEKYWRKKSLARVISRMEGLEDSP